MADERPPAMEFAPPVITLLFLVLVLMSSRLPLSETSPVTDTSAAEVRAPC